LSTIIAAINEPKAHASRFRMPLLILGLAGMAIYAADTVAAASQPYLPFDLPVERFIQSINWGPLVPVFKFFDEIEGTRQQLVAVAGIVLVAAVNWRAAPLMVVAALSGAIYSITAMVIQGLGPQRISCT
jgi:hypothetical protein